MDDEERLTSLLTDTARDTPPSRVIDIGAAVHQAHRQRTRRRIAGGVAVVATVALASTTATALLTDGRRAVVPPGTDVTSSAPPTVAVPVAPTAFDPMVARFTTGWLPDALPYRALETTADRQTLTLFTADAAPGEGANVGEIFQITIELYPAGVTPMDTNIPRSGPASLADRPTWPLPDSVAGPDVGRGPTWWSPSRGVLTWQWATDAWISLFTGGRRTWPDGQTNQDVLLHIGRTLRTDSQIPVRLPVTFPHPTGVGDLMRVYTLTSTTGEQSVTLNFSDRPDLMDPNTRLARMVTVAAARDDQVGSPKYGQPNATIGGHLAVVDYDARGGMVMLFNVDGYRISVSVTEQFVAAINRDDAIALASAVRVVPGAADPANWATDPIRP